MPLKIIYYLCSHRPQAIMVYPQSVISDKRTFTFKKSIMTNKLLQSTLFLVLLFITFSLQAMGQQNITLHIEDQDHIAVDGASVIISGRDSKAVVQTGITDIEGFMNVALYKGEYQVYVSSLGYKDTLLNITAPLAEPRLSITMTSSVTNIEGITVTARRHRPITRMEGGQIVIDVAHTFLGDLGNSIDVLKHSPGIRVDSKGNISLASLGGTNIYVNGKKIMLQGDALTAFLRSLPSTKIQKITTSPNPNAGYGSEGAGGIIEITMKEHGERGFFFTTSQGVSYWDHVRQNADVALSYNRDTWQLGINYNHIMGNYNMWYGSKRIQDGNKNLSTTDDTDKRNTHAGDIEFIFRPDTHHKLIANVAGHAIVGPGITETETQIFDGQNKLKQILRAMNDYEKQKDLRYSAGLSYTYTPDSTQSIRFNADYIRMNSNSTCNQPNAYYSPENTLLQSNLYHSFNEKHIDIYSLTADYRRTIGTSGELTAGVRTAKVKSDNDFRFQERDVLDDKRSNHFVYNENNLETYAQYTVRFGKWTTSAGMRVEYQKTLGQLHSYKKDASREENRLDRWKVFPNLSANCQLAKNTMLSLSYSMRQDKPRYEALNPFEYLLDELTYWKGNPFVTPQYGHKIIMGLSHRQLNVTLAYNQLNNYFTSITDEYTKGTIVMTTKNIGRQQQLAFDANYGKSISQWWNINANIGLYYFINRLNYERYNETYRRPSLTFSIANDFTLPWQLRLETSARYNSKSQGPSYEVIKSYGSIDAGISRNFMKDRLRLSLLMTDILHTERWDNYGTKGTLYLQTRFNGETRRVMFTARYNFGMKKFNEEKQKVKEAERL